MKPSEALRPPAGSVSAPSFPGSRAASLAGQVVRSPSTTSTPPPRSTNRVSTPPPIADGKAVSFSMRTACFSSWSMESWAAVGDAGGDRDPLLAREARARERDRRDGEVRRLVGGHRHGRQRRAFRKMHVLGAGPARLLEIADENCLAPAARRSAQNALRQL